MGRAVRQFEKEVSFRLGIGVEYVTSNCMGRAVRQFKKEVSFKLGKGVENVTSNCMGRAVSTTNMSRICYIELYGTRRPPVRKRKLVLNQKQN